MTRTDPHAATYMSLRLLTSGHTVHRTVEVIDNDVLVDLDEKGRVLGIEKISGPLELNDFGAVIRWLRAPQPDEAAS